MSFQGIVEIKTVSSTDAANDLLRQGWELLTVTRGDDDWAFYHLGRRAEGEKPSEANAQ
ncbi:hypothetical protein ACBQ21_03255 [Pseudomonas putida]|uniref:hypothetical protein n=1 Tax=Pseudomonas putida TaxID=303 RepID=UPI001BAED4AF|nr:hypothetical protein [Pseudomonas putida]EKT4565705.1 hypothetical protein [Pseudomonas putida]QUG90440.1 hypothetical protein GR140_17285 [Pseudomonas putida]